MNNSTQRGNSVIAISISMTVVILIAALTYLFVYRPYVAAQEQAALFVAEEAKAVARRAAEEQVRLAEEKAKAMEAQAKAADERARQAEEQVRADQLTVKWARDHADSVRENAQARPPALSDADAKNEARRLAELDMYRSSCEQTGRGGTAKNPACATYDRMVAERKYYETLKRQGR